nr:MAG TPA: hypothetical protein [Caudoviricetes sp.]
MRRTSERVHTGAGRRRPGDRRPDIRDRRTHPPRRGG